MYSIGERVNDTPFSFAVCSKNNVTSALNTTTAANLLSKIEYDLVLLDINLPDGNGYDLCNLIKPEHPDTLVIFLTANDQESDQLRVSWLVLLCVLRIV